MAALALHIHYIVIYLLLLIYYLLLKPTSGNGKRQRLWLGSVING